MAPLRSTNPANAAGGSARISRAPEGFSNAAPMVQAIRPRFGMGPRPERREQKVTTFDRNAFWRTLATSATVMVLGGGALLGLHMQKAGISIGALYSGPEQLVASISPQDRQAVANRTTSFVETAPIETGSISPRPAKQPSQSQGHL